MPSWPDTIDALYEIAGQVPPQTGGATAADSRAPATDGRRDGATAAILTVAQRDGAVSRIALGGVERTPKLIRAFTQPEPTEAEARASLAQMQEYVRERWGAGEAEHPAVDPLLTEGYQESVTWLRRTSPKTLERMVGARQTFEREENDFAAQTTVSCRRAMEALANALYPPSKPKASRDGVVRQLDAARYKNRLLAYLDEAEIEPSAAKVVSDELERHASRLDSISRQFGQHVHAEPTKNDAWLVYVQSWLVLIEFARLSA